MIHDVCRGDRSSGASALSRRRFLASMVAAGAGSLLTTSLGRGQTQPTALGKRIVDVHHHVFPPPFLKATESFPIGPSRARMVEWSARRSLTEMDATGVETAIVSITSPGIWFGNAGSALKLARECNDYLATLAHDYPGRFGFFAAIPLPDTKASLREIEYGLTSLKADGVGLMTSYGEKWPGDPAFGEVFDELNRRKAVVYLHPTTPMLSGRLEESGALFGMNDELPNGPEYELKRLHYEIANSAHRTAFTALTNLVPTSQVLFGTDYPFIAMSATAAGLTNLGLPTSDIEAIRRGNAAALFPRINAVQQGS
jgi:6-methylsalicylate decarboxylase